MHSTQQLLLKKCSLREGLYHPAGSQGEKRPKSFQDLNKLGDTLILAFKKNQLKINFVPRRGHLGKHSAERTGQVCLRNGPIQSQPSHERSRRDCRWLRGGMGLKLCLLLPVRSSEYQTAFNCSTRPVEGTRQRGRWAGALRERPQFDSSELSLQEERRTMKAESLSKSSWISCCWSQPFKTSISASFQPTSLSTYLDRTSSVCLWGSHGRLCWTPY